MSSADRSCVCSWLKCREWSALLASLPEHSCLSKLVKNKYSYITTMQKSLLAETSSKKRASIEAKIANHLRYRKVIIHHLQHLPSNLKSSRNGLFLLVENIARLIMKWIYQLRRPNYDPDICDIFDNKENSGYDQNR